MIRYVKQYGMQRTGTNYVRALLERNWGVTVLVNVLGWKHGRPVDWLTWLDGHTTDRGLVRARVGGDRFAEVEVDAAELRKAVVADRVAAIVVVRDPWYAIPRQMERDPKRYGTFESLCRHWNRNYRAWLRWRQHVRYEDLLAEAPGALAHAMSRIGLAAPQTVQDVPERCEPASDEPLNLRGDFQPRGYPEISDAAREAILAHLDWPLFESLGYTTAGASASREA